MTTETAIAPASPVVLRQDRPIVVETWPTTIQTILHALLAVAVVIQTLTNLVILYAFWRAYEALSALQDGLTRIGSVFGG